MQPNHNCKDMVIFLGAGFTHDLELPIMNNFNSASDREYDGITADNNKNKNATPYLKRGGKIFQKFQKYALNARKFMNIDINNMEDVFCLADIIEGTSIESNAISIPPSTESSVILISGSRQNARPSSSYLAGASDGSPLRERGNISKGFRECFFDLRLSLSGT